MQTPKTPALCNMRAYMAIPPFVGSEFAIASSAQWSQRYMYSCFHGYGYLGRRILF